MIINYTPLAKFAADNRVSYNELCAAVRAALRTDAAAPDGVIALTKLFHDTYERLAPSYGYDTRPDTREFDQHSKNGRLMIATVRAVQKHLAPEPPATQPQGEALTDEQIAEAVTRAYDKGNGAPPLGLWTGFKKDESGQYTVPNLRPMDSALVRLGINLASSNAAAGQLAQALDDLQCAVAFLDKVRVAPADEISGTGVTRDAREWLERAARAALQAHNKGTT